MAEIFVPESIPSGLIDTGASARKPIDAFEAAAARPNQPVEDALAYLGGARKISAAGQGMPTQIAASTAKTWYGSLPLEAYTAKAELAILYVFAGANGEGVVTVFSDTETGGKSVNLQHTLDLKVANAQLATVVLDVGSGDKNDLGVENWRAVIQNNNASAAVLDIHYVDIRPLRMSQITV